MPIENEGVPTNWTLRFKHGRLTILLFTEALTPFSTLKAELLDVLRERYPAGLPNPASRRGSQKQPRQREEHIAIPENVKDVALAVLVDQHDASRGWKTVNEGDTRGKDAMGLKACPKSVGLRDGGVMAFRFRAEDEEDRDGDENEDEDEDEDEEGNAETQKFWVEWPSYDETYGEAEPDEGDADMDDE